MQHEVKSVLIGIAVPFIGVLAGVIGFSHSSAQVAGFPLVLAWLFLWMPLTSACLHLAWRVDAPHVENEEGE